MDIVLNMHPNGTLHWNRLRVNNVVMLYLCLCSLAMHLYVDQTIHLNVSDSYHHSAEHRGEVDHTDYEHEDEYILSGLMAANTANALASRITANRTLTYSFLNSPLLPPPIAS